MLGRDRAVVTSGAHLRAEIERLGLDQVAVAEATGVSRQTINNIVNDRQPISRAMAAKLGRLTGRSSDYWLRSQFSENGVAYDGFGERATEESPRERSVAFRPPSLLVNHQIVRAVRDGVIVIDPFEEGRVQLASVDLTLHDFIITGDGKAVDITEDAGFALPPGRTVNAQTREMIEIPIDYVARVGPMARLARFGIVLAHGFQVDPGFKGHLEFCLLNAGTSSFQLRSGTPIISMEIMPLAARPTIGPNGRPPEPGKRGDVLSYFRDNDCGHAIRAHLRKSVAVDMAHGRILARIPELDIELSDESESAAIDNAVGGALRTMRLLSATNASTELSQRFAKFFDGLAEQIFLSAEQAQSAITTLGFAASGRDPAVARLRNGSLSVVQLPPGTAKVSLKNLARQLEEPPVRFLLALAAGRDQA